MFKKKERRDALAPSKEVLDEMMNKKKTMNSTQAKIFALKRKKK